MAALPAPVGFPSGDDRAAGPQPASPSHKRLEHREAASAHYHQVQDSAKQEDQHDAEGFSSFVAFCFTINFIVGVGILGIPHAMMGAGFVVSVLMLSVVCLVSWMAAQWLLEALARTHAIVHYIESIVPGHVRQSMHVSFDREQYLAEQERLFASGVPSDGAVSLNDNRNRRRHKPKYEISSERVIEIVDMFDVIMGYRWKMLYKTVLSLFIFGLLWGYASVFGSSMAARIPIDLPKIGLVINGGDVCDIYTNFSSGCNGLYWFYLILFACVVVPLTCMDLKDQKFFQVLLSICRFLMIGLMIGTVSYGASQNLSQGKPFGLAPVGKSSASGVLAFIPVAVFALICHHSIPAIAQHLKEKKQAGPVFGGAMFCCTILYTVLGVLVGSYYGMDVVASCVINWTKPGAPGALWIRSIIVIFPAFDILSAYPLNAITLAGNLRSKREKISWKQKIAMRITVAALPILGAGLLHDLNEILKWIGLVGLAIGFIFPAILNLSTKQKCIELFVNADQSHGEEQYVAQVLASSPMVTGRLIPPSHFKEPPLLDAAENSAKSEQSLTSPASAVGDSARSPQSQASPMSAAEREDLLTTPYTCFITKEIFVKTVLAASPILFVVVVIITAIS